MHLHFVLLLCILGHAVNATTTTGQFHNDCKKFFYGSTPPTGFNSQTNRYVCQRFERDFYFATLYDTSHRIPLYSAYKITEFDCAEKQPKRPTKWFIEPQLEDEQGQDEMYKDTIKNRGRDPTKQAINGDYSDSGFDRGHLNPNFHHCSSARKATFTLTNSIPQDPCFNRVVWYDIEKKTKKNMKEHCDFPDAQRYVIVGAIPSVATSGGAKRPKIENKMNGRVNIPGYSWTLSCCARGNVSEWWTGTIGENKEGGAVERFTDLSKMEEKLRIRYGYNARIKLLKDGCGTNRA